METEQATQVAALNDAFRRVGQGVTITPGVQELPDLFGLLEEVRHFDKWTQDNDPYEEHDFGSVDIDGNRVFWKIDYYDPSLTAGSDDPADPNITERVMTVMLAEEY